MTTRTKAELVTRVMRKGGWLDALNTPPSEDKSYIGDIYTDKLAEWDDLELVYWTADAIPSVIFEIIVDLVLNQVRDTYTRTGRTPALIHAEEEELLKRLRRHAQVQASGVTVPVDYF